MSDQKWIPKDRDWSEYPKGTLAKAIGGGYWEKTERGWLWHGGSTFPTPGGDNSGEVQLPDEPDPIRERILVRIEDLVADFCYYDRKEDEELNSDQLIEAVKNGEITVEEMVNHFRETLEQNFD